VGNAQGQLKLGKSASFVKTHLQQLKQESDTWEADFRALPTPQGETATQYLGLVVALPNGNPLVCLPVDYIPNVNDLADLLAAAMRRPMTEAAHRPQHIACGTPHVGKRCFPTYTNLVLPSQSRTTCHTWKRFSQTSFDRCEGPGPIR